MDAFSLLGLRGESGALRCLGLRGESGTLRFLFRLTYQTDGTRILRPVHHQRTELPHEVDGVVNVIRKQYEQERIVRVDDPAVVDHENVVFVVDVVAAFVRDLTPAFIERKIVFLLRLLHVLQHVRIPIRIGVEQLQRMEDLARCEYGVPGRRRFLVVDFRRVIGDQMGDLCLVGVPVADVLLQHLGKFVVGVLDAQLLDLLIRPAVDRVLHRHLAEVDPLTVIHVQRELVDACRKAVALTVDEVFLAGDCIVICDPDPVRLDIVGREELLHDRIPVLAAETVFARDGVVSRGERRARKQERAEQKKGDQTTDVHDRSPPSTQPVGRVIFFQSVYIRGGRQSTHQADNDCNLQ